MAGLIGTQVFFCIEAPERNSSTPVVDATLECFFLLLFARAQVRQLEKSDPLTKILQRSLAPIVRIYDTLCGNMAQTTMI